MSGAPTIWVNSDMSEQIADFNGEYVLITTQDMKKTMLGDTSKTYELARRWFISSSVNFLLAMFILQFI